MEVDYAVKVGESSVGVIHLKETIVQMISGWGIPRVWKIFLATANENGVPEIDCDHHDHNHHRDSP